MEQKKIITTVAGVIENQKGEIFALCAIKANMTMCHSSGNSPAEKLKSAKHRIKHYLVNSWKNLESKFKLATSFIKLNMIIPIFIYQ